MTNEPTLRSRRSVLKTAGSIGVATTGAGAIAGSAAAQPSVDITNVSYTLTQGGDQVSVSLVTVQVSGVSVNALNQNNVTVQIEDEVVNIEDVTIIGDDAVQIILENNQIVVNDVLDVSVAILGNSGISDSTQIDLTQ